MHISGLLYAALYMHTYTYVFICVYVLSFGIWHWPPLHVDVVDIHYAIAMTHYIICGSPWWCAFRRGIPLSHVCFTDRGDTESVGRECTAKWRSGRSQEESYSLGDPQRKYVICIFQASRCELCPRTRSHGCHIYRFIELVHTLLHLLHCLPSHFRTCHCTNRVALLCTAGWLFTEEGSE